MSQLDKLEQQLREHIAADLDRRADALFAAIPKMRKKSSEAKSCYTAGTVMRTAAQHVRERIEYHDGDAKSALTV